MNVLWEYSCDNCHFWDFIRDENYNESSDDSLCPVCGEEAVTLSKKKPADVVSIKIKPAAMIHNDVTNKVSYEKQYFIIVGKYDESEEYISKKIFTWEEVQNTIYKYRDCSLDKFLGLFGKNFQKLSPSNKLEIKFG